MKKILTLACALAMVAGANAQVRQARDMGNPVSAKMKISETTPVFMAPSQMAAKEEIYDTLGSQPLYDRNGGYITMSWTHGVAEDRLRTSAAVYFVLGSGWASCVYGGGEIGYSFDFTPSGWYQELFFMTDPGKVLVAAMTEMGRVPSTEGNVNNKRMPLRFKAYTQARGEVAEQKSFDNVTIQGEAFTNTITTVYPVDPTKYAAMTDTVGVPVLPAASADFPIGPALYGAKFDQQVPVSENLCVSLIFPTERTAEDSLWNATTFGLIYQGGDAVTSERPAAMYTVWDFEHNDIWDPEVTERPEGIVPDDAVQPNKRYAIMPMSSWVWKNDHSHLDYEIPLYLVLGESSAVERGASYDRYVEVKGNPAIDHTEFRSADKINKVEIYNVNGKLLKTQVCNDHNVEVRLDGFSSGMYVAKVTTEAGIANKKIMVR